MSLAASTTLGDGEFRNASAGELPARIGRFLVVARLGAGGMGVVYSAYDPELDRKVAIKVLRHAAADSEARARLQREARAMARLSDVHVVAVHDVGEHDGQLFIAMELVHGTTLRAWLHDAPRSWRDVVHVMRQAGVGLAVAHEAGIVHRDFKPENVLVDDRGRARVTDFGLARATTSIAVDGERTALERTVVADQGLTEHGTVIGTPAYMSPEQIMGRAADARADQFSFCVVLWEALYGERPFEGDNLVDLAANLIAGKRRPTEARDSTHADRDAPSKRRISVPTTLRNLLERGLSPKADDRYASMAELLVDLEKDPVRTRRRIAVATVLGAIGLVALGSSAFVDRMRNESCQEESTAIDSVWNADARTRVREAFEATGASFASSTIDHVSSHLDGYAEEWRSARHQACEASVVDREVPVDAYERTVACLEERRGRLSDLVEIMARADLGIVRNAIMAASQLPAIDVCTDPTRVAQLLLLPDDVTTRDAVRDIRWKLAQALNLETLGHYDEAFALADRLGPEARATGWDALIAEVDAELARMAGDHGEHDRAEAGLLDAHLLATASGADRIAVETACLLAHEVSEGHGRHHEGLVWGRVALAMLERMQDPDGYMAARAFEALGTVHQRAGKPDEAIAYLRRSLEIRERLLGPDHPTVGGLLENLCNAQRDLHDYDGAIGSCRRGVTILESAYGSHHPRIANTRLNLGNALLDGGAYADARVEVERSLHVLEQAFDPADEKIAFPLTTLAGIHERLGDLASLPEIARAEYEEASRLHERALRIRDAKLAADHPLLAESLLNVAGAHARLGAKQEAVPLLERAALIFEKSNPEHLHTGIALANLGDVLVQLGRAEEALGPLERACGILERTGGDSSSLAQAEFALGRALVRTDGDRSRAMRLVASARQVYALTGREHARELREIDTWTAGFELRSGGKAN